MLHLLVLRNDHEVGEAHRYRGERIFWLAIPDTLSLGAPVMLRRDFLKSLTPVVLMPQLGSAPRLKITDIRIVNLKSGRETGKMEAAWNPGTLTTHRIGGGSVIEVHTDQGLSGSGPAIDSAALESGKTQLIGRTRSESEQRAGPLRY